MRFIAAILLLILAAPAQAGLVDGKVYQPVSLADTEVTFAGEAPQMIRTTTADGLDLEGAYWPPEDGNDQVVIVFHGNSYNHMVMAVRAEPLRIGGRGVLVASYRGYGDNPGKPSEEGLYTDAEAWLAKARALQPDGRVYLFGFSLGGAVALEMAARHDVESVVTLGAFADLRSQVPRIARAFVKERYDNIDKLSRIEEPIFVLHGTKDDVVDPKAAVALEKAGGARMTRIDLTGGEHWVALDAIAERFWAAWEAAGVKPAAPSGNVDTGDLPDSVLADQR